MRLDGPWRRDPPAWSRRFREATIVGAGGDHGVRDAGHLGRHGRVPFPSPVRVLRIATDVVVKLPAKAVLLHPDGHRAGHPEGVSQPRVAPLRQVCGPAKLARLLGAEIKATILEKLSRAPESPKVTRLGEDDHREDRPDPGQCLQPDKVWLIRQTGHDVRL